MDTEKKYGIMPLTDPYWEVSGLSLAVFSIIQNAFYCYKDSDPDYSNNSPKLDS